LFLTDFASLKFVTNSSNYIIVEPLLMYSVFFLLIVHLLYYTTYYGEINDYYKKIMRYGAKMAIEG